MYICADYIFFFFFFYGYGDHRVLHVLTHAFPTRRSSDLQELLPQVPGGELLENGHALGRTYAFRDYYRTMSFVNALAHMANREDHHPDLGVHYDRCVVRYSTHDVGGLSENDFICAAKADLLAD